MIHRIPSSSTLLRLLLLSSVSFTVLLALLALKTFHYRMASKHHEQTNKYIYGDNPFS